MRKLRLELDALEVETFDTRIGAVPTVGTVRGHSDDPPDTLDPNLYSCNILSCGGTCQLSPSFCGNGCEESGADRTCQAAECG